MTTDLQIRPYCPDACDICGRCGRAGFPIVASIHYATRWIIYVCQGCLKPEEKAALDATIDEGLYRSGLR